MRQAEGGTGPLWKDGAGVITPSFLEKDAIFYYETNVPECVDIRERIAVHRDQIRGHPYLDQPELLIEIADLVSNHSHDLQNLRCGNLGRLLSSEKVD